MLTVPARLPSLPKGVAFETWREVLAQLDAIERRRRLSPSLAEWDERLQLSRWPPAWHERALDDSDAPRR